MVTVELPTVPLAIVATPDPLEVRLLLRALIDTRVPVPSLTSGLVLGKDVSFAIGTKPPTSSTRSIILSLIAAVVAMVVSLSGNVSPSLIVSPLLTLKYLASDADVVKYVASSTLCEACSELVTVAAAHKAVAVAALPVQAPDEPDVLPVTLPVRLPLNEVEVSTPVEGLYVNPLSVSAP